MSTLRAFAVGGVLWLTAISAGCAGSVTYRSYDSYYSDYDVWGGAEVPYYNTWIVETRRPRVEYRRLPRRDREAYWRWRHDHR